MKFRSIAAAFTAALLAAGVTTTASATTPADTGNRLMHRDYNSSDTLPWSGPGAQGKQKWSIPGGACSTVFQASDKAILALCTQYVGFDNGITPAAPSVVWFDGDTAKVVDKLELPKSGLLGGVYGFLDEQDRVVLMLGNQITRIGRADGKLAIVDRKELDGVPTDATSAGLTPDPSGNIWFATKSSLIGSLTPDGTVRTLQLPEREKITNGLTSRPDGVSVITSEALYEVAGPDPMVTWSYKYNSGSARKPGQLSKGSGTTPTFFGPSNNYVGIVDNADNSPNFIVLNAADGREVCKLPAFTVGGPGTENSVMAWGNSVWIPSTYGFNYPPMAVDGPSKPLIAPFTGGLTRIDVTDQGCQRVWENNTRFSTLPVLTRGDGKIWALSSNPDSLSVDLIGVDAATGREEVRRPAGLLPADEPLQLTGTVTPDGSLWQATATRMLKFEG